MRHRLFIVSLGALSAFITSHAQAQLNCGSPGSPENYSCVEAYSDGSNITADMEQSGSASAVYAKNSSTSNPTIVAVNSSAGIGVQASTSGGSGGNGVVGLYNTTATSYGGDSGVYGASSSDNGVFGTIFGSAGGAAVSGVDQTTNGAQYGVYGDSPSGYGVYGTVSNTAGVGVYGTGLTGVYGVSSGTNGQAVGGNASGTDGIAILVR